MQKGRIYLKDSSWWLRYRTPIIVSGHKKWKDRYERLCPKDRFETEKQIRVEYHTRINELLGEVIGITQAGDQYFNQFDIDRRPYEPKSLKILFSPVSRQTVPLQFHSSNEKSSSHG